MAYKFQGTIANFNISVGLTDEFMDAVRNEDYEPWTCRFNGKLFPLRRIHRKKRYNEYEIEEVEMTAAELFAEIIECAWRNGEPGCVFLDRANQNNPVPAMGEIHSSNPCGAAAIVSSRLTGHQASSSWQMAMSVISVPSTCHEWSSRTGR